MIGTLKSAVHVIWFLRVWFKRVFLPSTGFYKKLRVSSTGSERRKGLEKMHQLQFSIQQICNQAFPKKEENAICMLLISVFYITSLIFSLKGL